MKKCNDKTEKLLNYINDYVRSNGYPPTMREMKKALDYKSISTVS